MHLLLHPFTRERKKKNAKKKKPKRKRTQKKPKRIFSKTKKHIFKNEDAKKKPKRRRKFYENDVNLAVASTVYKYFSSCFRPLRCLLSIFFVDSR